MRVLRNPVWPALACTAMLAAASATARAQVPWVVFEDGPSGAVCDLVNAENLELVVLSNTGELVIVTGEDVILGDTFVDEVGQVFIRSEDRDVLVGFVEFVDDGDPGDFPTLWLTSLTGRVMIVNETTGQLTSGSFFPEDFVNVPCDACPQWDNQGECACFIDADCVDGDACTDDFCDLVDGCVSLEIDCEDGDPCTADECIAGTCVSISVVGPCDDGDECTVDDECLGGVCDGIPVLCDDEDPCTDDVCDSVEGCLFIVADCDDGNPCTDDICEGEFCIYVDNDDLCNDGDPCTEDDFCEAGECGGFLIPACDDDPPPPITISICRANAGIAMILSIFSLCAVRRGTQRRFGRFGAST